MSNILDDFEKANNYFDENRERIIKKYKSQIAEFEKVYNQIVKNPPPVTISAELGTALALQYRALSFLFSSLRLVLEGHTHEAMILVRNALEMRIVALDIGFNKMAFNLWQTAQYAKEHLRKRDGGIIDSIKLKKLLKEQDGKNVIDNMTFIASFKRTKANPKLQDGVNQIIRSHGEISEYRSHESIFNLVRRVDIVRASSGREKTDVYIGYDASSNLEPFLQSVIKELKNLFADIRNVTQN